MVFKLGESGQGYYWDSVPITVSLLVAVQPLANIQAVTLVLDVLMPVFEGARGDAVGIAKTGCTGRDSRAVDEEPTTAARGGGKPKTRRGIRHGRGITAAASMTLATMAMAASHSGQSGLE